MPARPPPTTTHVRARGSGARASLRQPAACRLDVAVASGQSRVNNPPSSIVASATAPIGTGRTGMRGVATGRLDDSGRPWRRAIIAAICALAVPPLAQPHAGAREALDDVEVGRTRRSPRSSSRTRHLLAAADDGLVASRARRCPARPRAGGAAPRRTPRFRREAARGCGSRARSRPRPAVSAPRSSGGAERGEAPLVDRDVRARDAGAVARGRDAGDGRAQPLVADDDRAAEVLVVARTRSPRAAAARPRGRTRSRRRACRRRRAPRCRERRASRRRRRRGRRRSTRSSPSARTTMRR